VRCREAEAGVCFIGPGRWWGGGEAADGSGVLLLIGFKGVKGGRGTGRHRFSGGSEGGMTALRFSYLRVEEGGSWWRTTWRRGQRGGDANGSRRWESMPWWAVPGQKAERSKPVSVGVKERRKWAKQRNWPKAKEAAA
jgi:hypothetical protein